MKLTPEGVRLSATDVAHHLACRHLTALDLDAARGRIEPPRWRDPAIEVLEQRGLRHESAYIDHLRAQGLEVVDLRGGEPLASATARTHAAMQSGAAVIVQATLTQGRWLGRADVLLRVEAKSELGPWSYEVVDTKLARETRGGTILQLCLYSELVGALQNRLPARMHVVAPGTGFAPETYELCDVIYYYRHIKRRLEASVDAEVVAPYPEPVSHCDICRWWPRCDRRRRDDDHLSLVAGLSRLQAHELQRWSVTTLTALGELALPLEHRPRRGALASYVRAREQARVQLAGRRREHPVHELLEREPGRGLARLPAPDAGDLFLDFEGDPFAGENGIEYLMGVCDGLGVYEARWAFDARSERAAFEWLVDFITARCERFPDLHVYHFAPYEPATLRRLMGRHASREAEVDALLRAERFVDLHGVVKQALRASVERYSIKDLEAFYGYEREVALREASLHKRALERALELDCIAELGEEPRGKVLAYNRDDCRSALRLRDWLEGLRADLVARGETIERPEPKSGEPKEKASQWQARVAPVKQALVDGLPETRGTEEQARWLLAQLLEWHARESKAPWWEYFRLRDLSDDELVEEKSAIAGLEHLGRVGGTDACPIDRYSFPPQNTQVRAESELHTRADEKIGTVAAIDVVERTVDVKKTRAARDAHPAAAFAHSVVGARVIEEAVLRLGEWCVGHGVDAEGEHRAARDLLLARHPRLAPGCPWRTAPDEDPLARARRLALGLDSGVLAIQGPPGSGKTYTAARMICELVKAGKNVGVTAVPHKVIRNLLEQAMTAAAEEGLTVRCVQKPKDEPVNGDPRIRELADNAGVRAAIAADGPVVAGGTAWMWSRADFAGAVDVLFVDEAGQMSLADVLAASQAARSVVLLGDPQQLDQPQQGSHPPGTNVSALEHLLAGEVTIADERGLFLAETWRLHPSICAYTSELFYEGRLHARPDLAQQALAGDTPFAGAGLWFVPVEHDGNQSAAPEEVEAVERIVAALLHEGVAWRDKAGVLQPLTLRDVLVVAPYNAQVSELARRLGPEARVGTVDRFQGQEAAVVIYSMATSSPEDAPRGMEFLYSLNRLNVATSRARCASILVASPRLLEPECEKPAQMRLANAFCRYRDLATLVRL